MQDKWLVIKQLDRQLSEWQSTAKKCSRPRFGWIKTIRTALSMSVDQLANRLNVTRGRISQLENAEVEGAVTLRSLREAANALGCDLVYAIVPKDGHSLEKIIEKRAEEIANERVTRVAHSMSLEDQSVNEKVLKDQKKQMTLKFKENLNKKFWQLHQKKKLK